MKSLSFKDQIIFSIGSTGTMTSVRVLTMWILAFLVPATAGAEPYLSASMVGLAVMVSQIVDGAVDPFIGIFSEKVRSPWGRRKIMLAISILPTILLMLFAFNPTRFQSESLRFFYLVVVLAGYSFFFSLYTIPYLALIPEVTNTDRERARLASCLSFFTMIGVFLAMVPTGVLVSKMGIQNMVLVAAAICLVMMAVPVLFFPENQFSKTRPQSSGKVWTQFKELIQNKMFLKALAVVMASQAAYNVLTMSSPYAVTAVLGRGQEWSSILLGTSFFLTLLSFPLASYLIQKLGKKKVAVVSLVLLAVFYALLFGQYFVTSFEIKPIYALVTVSLVSIPTAVVLVLTHVLVGDCVDVDAAQSGLRRESVFYGMYGLITKLGVALSTLLYSVVMQKYGYTAEKNMGVLLAGPLCALFMIVALMAFVWYPSDKEVAVLVRRN